MIDRLLSMCVLIALPGLLLGASDSRRDLSRADLGLENPLAYSTSYTGAALSAAVTSIGSNVKALLITPGTWNITSNLTIPANITVQMAAGALFDVSGGVTLTINGPFDAGLRQVFTGAGSVVFGSRTPAVHPHWFGAACDGVTNDASALKKALAAAAASASHRVWMPGGICRVTSAVALQTNVDLVGQGKFASTIEVCGAGVKGLTYEPASLTGFEAALRQLRIQGCDQTVGDLISFKNAGRVYIEDVSLSRTGGNGIKFDFVIESLIKNVMVHQYSANGVYMTGNSNTFNIEKLSVQTTSPSEAALYLRDVAFGRVTSSAFEGYGSAGKTVGRIGWKLDGVGATTFEQNFIEYYKQAVQATGDTRCFGLEFIGNHFHDHTAGNATIDFSPNHLAHDGVYLSRNRCVQDPSDACFDPGASTNWSYENGSIDLGKDLANHAFQPKQVVSYDNPVQIKGGFRVTSDQRVTDGTIRRIIVFQTPPFNFGATPANSCEDLGTGGITGAASGDPCFVGAPVDAWAAGTSEFSCFVSNTDTVAIRRCNPTTSALPPLRGKVFNFVVFKYTLPPN